MRSEAPWLAMRASVVRLRQSFENWEVADCSTRANLAESVRREIEEFRRLCGAAAALAPPASMTTGSTSTCPPRD